MIISSTEQKLLKKCLALTPEPDQAFSYDELCGFVFGLAINPGPLQPDEWLATIYGGVPPSGTTATRMTACLLKITTRGVSDFHHNKLIFPFDIGTLTDTRMEQLYEWISGFEEALTLHEELWDPEEYPDMPDRQREELFHAMLTIQGLVDPGEVIDFFDNLSDELFEQAFPDITPPFDDRETQIQMLLLASLPLTMATLMAHARFLKGLGPSTLRLLPPRASRQASPTGAGSPCTCNRGQGCGSGHSPAAPSKKPSNIITVDFQRRQRTGKPDQAVFQLRVELVGAKPSIWRRLMVPAQTSLPHLHNIIETCLGRRDNGEHHFLIGGTAYRPAASLAAGGENDQIETEFRLVDLAALLQPSFHYVQGPYGGWRYLLEVEKIEPNPTACQVQLIAGGNASPPEASSGLSEYLLLVQALTSPENPGHPAARQKLGADFDPADFGGGEIAAINRQLRRLAD